MPRSGKGKQSPSPLVQLYFPLRRRNHEQMWSTAKLRGGQQRNTILSVSDCRVEVVVFVSLSNKLDTLDNCILYRVAVCKI